MKCMLKTLALAALTHLVGCADTLPSHDPAEQPADTKTETLELDVGGRPVRLELTETPSLRHALLLDADGVTLGERFDGEEATQMSNGVDFTWRADWSGAMPAGADAERFSAEALAVLDPSALDRLVSESTAPGGLDTAAAALMRGATSAVNCEARDGSAKCSCAVKCWSSGTDCGCQDGQGNPSPKWY